MPRYLLLKLLHWLSSLSSCMLFVSSLKFCLRWFLIFSTSEVFISASWFVFKSVVIAFWQCFRSLNSYMAHFLYPENERELCLFGRLSSNIICGPTRIKNDWRICIWDEHIMCDSFQNFSSQNTAFCTLTLFTKTKHTIKLSYSHPQFPLSTLATPGTMTPSTPFWRPRQNSFHFMTRLSQGSLNNTLQ